MKLGKSVFVCLALMAAFSVQVNRAWAEGESNEVSLTAQMVHPTGGGGDGVPTPFDGSNQVAELADGERYVLVGKIEIRQAETAFGTIYQGYLAVDLAHHAWLANAKRRLDPAYRLQGSGDFWKNYEGKTVRVNAVAHGSIERPGKGLAAEYVISLEVTK